MAMVTEGHMDPVTTVPGRVDDVQEFQYIIMGGNFNVKLKSF